MNVHIVGLLGITFLLSACGMFQQTVDSNTTAFFTTDFKIEGSIAVVAADEKVASSLEFLYYKKKFEIKLSEAGFIIEPEASKADYLALIAYGIDNGETAVISTPIYGQTSNAYYFDRQYIMPSYGVVGMMNESVTNFNRAIAMDIVKAKNTDAAFMVKVYESRTKSIGGCPVMLEVFDEMLEAMFKAFPSGNASHRIERIPAIINC